MWRKRKKLKYTNYTNSSKLILIFAVTQKGALYPWLFRCYSKRKQKDPGGMAGALPPSFFLFHTGKRESAEDKVLEG